MSRVIIICEGPTEARFISDILGPYFWSRRIYLHAMLLGVPGQKGGNVKYTRVRKDILLLLKQDANVFCSTMFDLYGLGSGFPGTVPPTGLVAMEKATHIENAIREDILREVPNLRPALRFIPYLQVHEYEGLLFSDTEAFANALGKANLASQLASIRNTFATPEDINDHPNTAPSKRILAVYPQYNKVIEGTVVAQRIGINRMLQECPHFRNWIERLTALPGGN
ncbi:DUF4276 family protein [Alloacidobacterium sp.]|uniref:DUF4276 family protein n=1 Tax=Alloacidobacterium sp. TaxID=2951999 RepID=UPI002D2DDD9D|nr:DUF4276 family protein [Alloacidobacterium sp.]HYK37034.1 DUF4276 family protein [Alloacidobacterium sp.]